MGGQNKKLLEIFFLVFISVLYLCLSVYNLYLPGLYGDETGDANTAIQILRHEKSEILSYMSLPYFGPIQIYALLPFFALLGANVYSLRFATILYGLIALIFFYLFSKKFFNLTVAIIATILLTISPTFIFFNRQGIYTNSIILIPLFGSLYFFLLGFIKKRAWYYYIGSFFFGIGITTKLTFWWVIPPIIFLFILNKKKIILTWLDYVFCFIIFCASSLPIIIYNIKTRLGTFTYLFYERLTDYNFNLLTIFTIRFNNFKDLLQGNLNMLYFGIHQSNILFLILFIISFFSLFMLVISRKKEDFRNHILFVLIFISSVLLESVISPSYMISAHIFMLLPFAILTISILCYKLYNLRIIKIFIILILLIVISINIKMTLHYHAYLKKTGGVSFMSDTIYDVSDYLEKNQIFNPMYSHHFLEKNLYFLSNGQINKKEIYEVNCIPSNQSANSDFSDSQQFYISYADDIWILDNVSFLLEKVFYSNSSRPIYLVYKIYDNSCISYLQNSRALYISNPDYTKIIHIDYCSSCNAQYQLMNYSNQKLLKLYYFIPNNRNKMSSILHKILENVFLGNQEYGYIFLRHDYKYLNFSNYSSINIYVRSDDNQTSGLEFQIKESDGDAWYYFDNQSLSSTNWTLIHMPFENFTNPSWAQKGDKKKTFTELELIGITLTSFDNAVNKTVYFKTFGDQIFFLD